MEVDGTPARVVLTLVSNAYTGPNRPPRSLVRHTTLPYPFFGLCGASVNVHWRAVSLIHGLPPSGSSIPPHHWAIRGAGCQTERQPAASRSSLCRARKAEVAKRRRVEWLDNHSCRIL